MTATATYSVGLVFLTCRAPVLAAAVPINHLQETRSLQVSEQLPLHQKADIQRLDCLGGSFDGLTCICIFHNLLMQTIKIGLFQLPHILNFFCLLSSLLSCQIKQLINEYAHYPTIFALSYGAIYMLKQEYVCSAILQKSSMQSHVIISLLMLLFSL